MLGLGAQIIPGKPGLASHGWKEHILILTFVQFFNIDILEWKKFTVASLYFGRCKIQL